MHDHIDLQNKEIAAFQERANKQDTNVSQLEDRVQVLTTGISQALKGADDNEQYSRIKGIDKERDETATKCIDKVITVCKHSKVDITKNNIERAHRVVKDRSTMIVKFFSFLKRTSVY